MQRLFLLLSLLLPSAPASSREDHLDALLPNVPTAERVAAFEQVSLSKDRRFLAPLVDLLRFADTRQEWYRILDAISAVLGEDVTELARPWHHLTLRLAADEELPAFDSYTKWKGELLARTVDETFRDLLHDGVATRVRLDEVVWGGVAFDGIPALTDPEFLPAFEATYLEPDDPVFGVSVGFDHRAYPLRILDWHEMANDVVGGVPVSLAYCTLCGAGVLYRAELDGERITFGSSGLLMRSNKLMYDRGTRSLWNQLTGRPVIGELCERDIELEVLPLVLTTWGAWSSRHPDTTVLHPDTGFLRDYRTGAAYGDYFASQRMMFPAHGSEDSPHAKDQVFVVRSDGHTQAFELDELRANGLVHAQLEDEAKTPILLVYGATHAPVPLPESWTRALAEHTRIVRSTFRELSSADLELLVDHEPEKLAEITDEALLDLADSARRELLDRLGQPGVDGALDALAIRLAAGIAVRGLAAEVRAFRTGDRRFQRDAEGGLLDQDGVRWEVTERGLRDPEAARLERLPGHLAFRFGSQAFAAKQDR